MARHTSQGRHRAAPDKLRPFGLIALAATLFASASAVGLWRTVNHTGLHTLSDIVFWDAVAITLAASAIVLWNRKTP